MFCFNLDIIHHYLPNVVGILIMVIAMVYIYIFYNKIKYNHAELSWLFVTSLILLLMKVFVFIPEATIWSYYIFYFAAYATYNIILARLMGNLFFNKVRWMHLLIQIPTIILIFIFALEESTYSHTSILQISMLIEFLQITFILTYFLIYGIIIPRGLKNRRRLIVPAIFLLIHFSIFFINDTIYYFDSINANSFSVKSYLDIISYFAYFCFAYQMINNDLYASIKE